jgi:hypothetical protein
MTSWAETLDAFEARIAEQRAALDRGELEVVPPFVAPPGLGELRGADLVRARALLDETDDLVTELEGTLQHTREDLMVVDQLKRSTTDAPVARFIDTAL